MLAERDSAPRSLKLLNEVHRALARPLTEGALAELILDSAFTHLQPEDGGLFLRGPDGALFCAARRGGDTRDKGMTLSRQLVREVADGGQAALVQDLGQDARFRASQSLMDIGVRTLLAAPLLDDQGSAGMIVLHSRQGVRPFSEEDLELLVSLASAATLRLRSIAAAEASAKRALLDKELALAHEIQMGMLPRRFPARPEFDLAAALRPARSVGGDLYDFILEGSQLHLLVGDVSGKGVGAALFMAVTRTLFRAVVPGASGLGEVAFRLNQELARDNDRAMFVTAFLACLDLKTGALEFANAGHNPPYRLEASGEVCPLAGGRGIPLGVFPDQAYSTDTLALRPGEAVYAFTDGVTEAFRADGAAFGESRLEDLLRRSGALPSSALVEATLLALDGFVAGAPPADDVTVLALRYRG
jgi:sigma-B regulation protein RsbU (phosphoserine phosphatase)